MTAALSLFQESEPISRYLHVEIGTELRQRLAKMGMDMLLKMVGILDSKREPTSFLPVPALCKGWAGYTPA